MRILILHGANLNLLGERQPEIYGTQTLTDINDYIASEARRLNLEIEFAQYNVEGDIINALHDARTRFDAIVINPGAYSHYSYAIADAIASLAIPVIEVHLSNTAAREPHRRVSVTGAAARGTIAGFGANSYVLALHALAQTPEK